MRILLVGEYSRLHNSLKEGLQKLNHEVTILSLGDGFKNYPSDVKIKTKYNNGFSKKAKNLIFKVSGYNLESYATYLQVKKFLNTINYNFDVVQLINENSLLCTPFYEKKIIKLLKAKTKKMFLLSCGTDCKQMQYFKSNPDFNSIYTPYRKNLIQKENFAPIKYFEKDYQKLSHYIYNQINGVIATDFDYVPALTNHPKFLGLIPNPINTDLIQIKNKELSNKIVIFHGINECNYFLKGNNLFEQALLEISKKYGDKIEIITTKSIPYNTYINLYNKCDILLDQVYANDQGYNALEAMAKEKVVFTGASEMFTKYYSINEEVVVKTQPNLQEIITNLERLILNPNEINEIAKRAKMFVNTHHNYIKIAEKYVLVWKEF